MKISEKQLSLVDKQIKRIIASGNYYSEIYKKAGITGVSTSEDFEKIPFTDKAVFNGQNGSSNGGPIDQDQICA